MRKYYLLNIIIAAVLFLIFYSGVAQNEFLFVHDQYLELASYGNNAGLFTINPANYGESNVLGLLAVFWDRVLYCVSSHFGISIPWIQRILVFVILNYVLTLPLVGFTKIARAFSLPVSRFTLYVISLFFTFNTYTLILWNCGEQFSVTQSLTYALIPLAFIVYHKAVFGESQFIEKAKSCLLIFMMAFAINIFMAFTFFLIIYSIIYIIINHNKYKTYFSNISMYAALYIPLALVLLVVPYEFSSSANSDSITGGGSGSLKGGLLYQMLMWFSWPIYTPWEPRSIFAFHNYFNEPLSIVAPFLLYAVLIYYFIWDKTRNRAGNTQVLIIFLVLLILFVFVKGAQAPWGDAYLLLLKYMPLSSVFRTPDTKFGLGIIFAIALLFIYLSNKTNKSFIASVILIVIAIQCYPLFTGLAVRGEKLKAYRSRIVSVSQEYAELMAYVNTHNEPYGYVLPLPSINYGYYRHDPTGVEGFIGQDLLPMLSSLPFVYLAKGTISKAAYDQTIRILHQGNSDVLDTVPIKYILLRKDVIGDTGFSMEAKDIPSAFIKVFENSLFSLYSNTKYGSLVYADDMTFKMISPVKYALSLKNINKERALTFLQNYRDSWSLYPAASSTRPEDRLSSRFDGNNRFTLEDLSFLWRKPCFAETHSLYNGYANSWKLTPAYIKDRIPCKYYKTNADGSIDLKLILFNRTQSLFYNTALISFGYALILLCMIVIKSTNLRIGRFRA